MNQAIPALVVVAALTLPSVPLAAQTFVFDGDAAYGISGNDAAGTGRDGIFPDSTINHIWNARWFFQGGGSSGTFDLPTPTISTSGNTLTLTGQQGSAFRYTINISILDGAAPGQAIAVQEFTYTPLAGYNPSYISFYHHLDVAVGGTSAGDTGTLIAPGVLRFDDSGGDFLIFEAVTAPSSWVLGTWDGSLSVVMNQFGILPQLPNSASPFGPGDLGGAFQWILMNPTGPVTLRSRYMVNVPSPGAAALIGLAAAAAWGVRRRGA